MFLVSCVEVEQKININRDGSGSARFEITIQKPWDSDLIPRLKKSIPQGWVLENEEDRNGKKIISFYRKFEKIDELNNNDAVYSLAIGKTGFMKNVYVVTVRYLKNSDPFPFILYVSMPGKIERTNGAMTTTHEVKWNSQGFRRGTVLYVNSSAFVMPPLLTTIIVMAVLAISVLVFFVIYSKKKKQNHLLTQPLNEPAIFLNGFFCTQCGTKNPPDAVFCENCGEKL